MRDSVGDVWKDGGRWQFVPNFDDLTGSEWCADQRRPRADEWRSNAYYLENKIGATIWTSRLCRVEDESVQLNELLLQALIDWADLATRHSPAAL